MSQMVRRHTVESSSNTLANYAKLKEGGAA
jgi:hypothetical protein